MERRECNRFEVFGAVLFYKCEKGFFRRSGDKGIEAPIYDLSFGGLRFLSDSRIELGTELDMEIRIPGESEPLRFKGKAVWDAPHPGQSYSYQIGVQFHPYGEKKGLNPPENLERLKAIALFTKQEDKKVGNLNEAL